MPLATVVLLGVSIAFQRSPRIAPAMQRVIFFSLLNVSSVVGGIEPAFALLGIFHPLLACEAVMLLVGQGRLRNPLLTVAERESLAGLRLNSVGNHMHMGMLLVQV